MDTETFIAEVLARPAIWKLSDPQHKYKHIVKRLWNEIKKKFPNSEVGDLKKKWKNLRDIYRKELKKIPKSRSGDPSLDYEPSWKYFSMLGFLKDECMPLIAESNMDEGDSEVAENGNNDITIEVINPLRSPSPTRTSSPIEQSPSLSQSSRNKRQQQDLQDIRTQYLEVRKKLKLLENDIAKTLSVDIEKKSDDYCFLMSILPEMEKLPTSSFRVLRGNSVRRTDYQVPDEKECAFSDSVASVNLFLI
ncbi:unnamed protein product [Leptosia nina]|uniref:MADF domain-containing protein n=1 Tax=Leptosia nina TaxID=320188 RepID=A0AAV1JJJ8_9NEOP